MVIINLKIKNIYRIPIPDTQGLDMYFNRLESKDHLNLLSLGEGGVPKQGSVLDLNVLDKYCYSVVVITDIAVKITPP